MFSCSQRVVATERRVCQCGCRQTWSYLWVSIAHCMAVNPRGTIYDLCGRFLCFEAREKENQKITAHRLGETVNANAFDFFPLCRIIFSLSCDRVIYLMEMQKGRRLLGRDKTLGSCLRSCLQSDSPPPFSFLLLTTPS